MMRLRVGSICLVLMVLIVACGTPRSSGFSEIDRSKIPQSLSATTTTTTTTTTTIPQTTTTIEAVAATTTTEFIAPTTTIASALVRLYFVTGKDAIVPIDVPIVGRDPSVAQVMSALESAPTGESAFSLRTAIPPDEHPNARNDGRGLVTVDLSSSFKEAAAEDQRVAIAQMVLTFTHLSGFSQVQFTMDGQPVPVTLADGTLSEAGQILYADDYTDLLSTSATPPPTTTSTTAPSPDSTDSSGTVEEPTTLPTN